ncbi:hypothetical protein ACPPVO_05480 [Dactylosporangium sp. McL0621]|uniref:hypothetical protein n=1 Tax=Dactylosporangium sp. McL0621 TaxID=3415678 RepID=UPI003CEDC710
MNSSDDLERRLRRELTADRQALPLPAEAVMAHVERELRRGRMMRRTGAVLGAAVAAAAIIVTIGVLARPGGSIRPQPGDPATTGITGSVASPTAAPLALRGVAEALTGVADVDAAARREPALKVWPREGRRAAFVRSDGSTADVWRVVVVEDGAQDQGLPGVPLDLPASWNTGGQFLLTDDGSTLYLKAWQPDGHRWFVAVTGATEAARLEMARPIVQQNFTM